MNKKNLDHCSSWRFFFFRWNQISFFSKSPSPSYFLRPHAFIPVVYSSEAYIASICLSVCPFFHQPVLCHLAMFSNRYRSDFERSLSKSISFVFSLIPVSSPSSSSSFLKLTLQLLYTIASRSCCVVRVLALPSGGNRFEPRS